MGIERNYYLNQLIYKRKYVLSKNAARGVPCGIRYFPQSSNSFANVSFFICLTLPNS